MRLALVRMREDEYRFLWNHHHLVFDGWCTGIILRDVFTAYESLARGAVATVPPPPRPFRDYVNWLAEQDLGNAEAFWRRHLSGIRPAPRLRVESPRNPNLEEAVAHRSLSAPLDLQLRRFAGDNSITLNTIVMAAWSIVLSRRLSVPEVVFGSTVAARPAGIEGIEEMVGLFINTLPVRVSLSSDLLLLDLLASVQVSHAKAREFEHVSLAQIRRWSGLELDKPLFETAVVFENLPEFSVGRRPLAGLDISAAGSFVRNHFPFTLRGIPGPPLSFDALFDPHRFSLEDAAQLLEEIESVIAHIVQKPMDSVGYLLSPRTESVGTATARANGGASMFEPLKDR